MLNHQMIGLSYGLRQVLVPNFRVDDPENYIKGFNWVSNWIELYFFNKVSDFLLGIFFLLIIVFLIFYSKTKINIKIKNKII